MAFLLTVPGGQVLGEPWLAGPPVRGGLKAAGAEDVILVAGAAVRWSGRHHLTGRITNNSMLSYCYQYHNNQHVS